jgi:hypothetical protein
LFFSDQEETLSEAILTFMNAAMQTLAATKTML